MPLFVWISPTKTDKECFFVWISPTKTDKEYFFVWINPTKTEREVEKCVSLLSYQGEDKEVPFTKFALPCSWAH